MSGPDRVGIVWTRRCVVSFLFPFLFLSLKLILILILILVLGISA